MGLTTNGTVTAASANSISSITGLWRGLMIGGDGLYSVFFIFFCLSL